MFTRHKATAPQRQRAGLTSVCLLAHGDVAADCLAVTWVDVAPGGRQPLHNHPEVQVYIVTSGTGTMQVGDRSVEVSPGQFVYVPSGAFHGITNTGDGILTCVTAATPAFDFTEAYDRGQLTHKAFANQRPPTNA